MLQKQFFVVHWSRCAFLEWISK